MTKKDYELIAKSISDALNTVKMITMYHEKKDLIIAGISQTATSLSLELEKENPRFDSDKFLKACRL